MFEDKFRSVLLDYLEVSKISSDKYSYTKTGRRLKKMLDMLVEQDLQSIIVTHKDKRWKVEVMPASGKLVRAGVYVTPVDEKGEPAWS